MRSDLDDLMERYGIHALLVSGSGQFNPAMVYFTGKRHITKADLIKIRGESPILFHNPIEREEAKSTGLTTKNYLQYPFNTYIERADGDNIKATAYRYKDMLHDCGFDSGRISLYGQIDFGFASAVSQTFKSVNPEIEVVYDPEEDVLLEARTTKASDEIERIKNVGKATIEIVEEVKDFLSSCRVKNEAIIKTSGNPLTIGDIKNKINLLIAEHGLENPNSVIFSIGREAAIPHSSGSPDGYLHIGAPVIFDIFPCEKGGGYFHDLTRTWCLGYAKDEALEIYECVNDVYNKIVARLEINKPFHYFNNMANELFSAAGYETLKTNPKTESGFVHSLGHGVGLNIHERPFCNDNASRKDVLERGVVFTIEPGLYLPERGIGVRLENTFVCNADGEFESLVEFPLDLIVPIKT